MIDIEFMIDSFLSEARTMTVDKAMKNLYDISIELESLDEFEEVDFIVAILKGFIEREIESDIVKVRLQEVGLNIQEVRVLSKTESQRLAVGMLLQGGMK